MKTSPLERMRQPPMMIRRTRPRTAPPRTSAAPSNARNPAAMNVRVRFAITAREPMASADRAPPPGEHNERRVGDHTRRLERERLVGELGAAVLEEIGGGIPLDTGGGEGIPLDLAERHRGGHVEADLVPRVLHHDADRHRRHRRRAHAAPSGTGAAGRVERKRSTCWSKRSVEARTLTPAPAGKVAKAISSPPCPRSTK